MTRAEACRKAAEDSDSDNERIAWTAAGVAWDTLQEPKRPLSARGRYLASLYTMTRMLATVQSAQAAPEAPTASPEPPAPEPVKPRPTGAFAAIEF